MTWLLVAFLIFLGGWGAFMIWCVWHGAGWLELTDQEARDTPPAKGDGS